MNVFLLHHDPVQAALMHCDQHMNKMIVESAQILSTAARMRQFDLLEPNMSKYLMKPAYDRHPIVRWAAESNHNMHWIATLALSLEDMRESRKENGATPVIRLVRDILAEHFSEANWTHVGQFIYCGAAPAKSYSDWVVGNYRNLYEYKAKQWRGTTHAMSYRGRGMPWWLSHYRDWIPHEFVYDRETYQLLADASRTGANLSTTQNLKEVTTP